MLNWEGPGFKNPDAIKPVRNTSPSEAGREKERDKSAEKAGELLWEGDNIKELKIKDNLEKKDLKEERMMWESDTMRELRPKRPLSPEEQALHEENERQIKEDQEQTEKLRKIKMSSDELLKEEGFIGAGEGIKGELAFRIREDYKPEIPPVPVRKHAPDSKGFFKRIWNKLFK
ncbi:MAG TPA: hypothetical protein PLK35_03530 [Candidatus Moranbacteria bacterium]|nr:hypothetical protein [Candidatus Moranbacteria bacterium]